MTDKTNMHTAQQVQGPLAGRTVRKRITSVIVLLAVFLYAVTGVFLYTRGSTHAAASSTLNFQARLLDASGQLVADGSYNIQFNLYTTPTGGTSLWTETRSVSAAQGVTVKNGYFSVSLGEVTAFPGTISWDQELWLGMTVQGTSSCVFNSTCTPADAEMSPRFKLTAVPFAFRAAKLMDATSSNAFTADELVQKSPASAQIVNTALAAIRLNQTSTGGLLQLQGAGSDVFTVDNTGATVVAGNVTTNGNLFTNNGATLNNALVLTNFATSGTIGTAATTVDIKTAIAIPQTTAAVALTLPAPTLTTAGRLLYVSNTGTTSFTLNGTTVNTNTTVAYMWNGTAWALAGGGSGGADTLQTAYDNSVGGIITTTATDGAVRIRDAATTFGNTTMFALQNNAGTIDYLGVQGDGDLAVDTNTLFVDALNNRIGIGTATPTATLQVTTQAPASVTTATGTAQVNIINAVGGAGGNTTIATTGTGGIGGAFVVTGGVGGQATAAATSSTGGAGGAITQNGGAGGAAAVAGTGNNIGGVGGAYTVTAGSGGAATGATTGNNTGGAGGLITLQAGTGGAATTGSGNLVGGAGGALNLRGGTGGVGVTSGGAGGAVSLQGGTAAAMAGAAGGAVSVTAAAGSATGSGGNGGALTLSAGSAGGDNTVNRTGGAVTISAGASRGASTGGALTLNGGAGGQNLTVAANVSGPASGGITINGGNGGTAPNATTTSTGGAAGGLTFTGGVGGAASAGGTVNNVGGGGGTTRFTGGTGGIANGATTGSNTGGAGGGFILQAGTGGAATVGSGTRIGGTGGTVQILGGTGGAGLTGGNGGGVSIQGGQAAAIAGAAGGAVTIAGRAGSTTGSGGAGGNLSLTAGAAGGDQTVARAGGNLSLAAGAARGPTAGGAVSVVAGSGGNNLATGTAVGGNAGGISFNGANGGTAPNADISSTGGTAGGFAMNGGTGGAASVAGTGNNTGGSGGAFTWTAGTGGAANGATSGVNTGGLGGTVSLSAGTGGAASVGTGTLQGGNGGDLVLNGGRGGNGTTTGIGGDIILRTTANNAVQTERFRVSNAGYVGIGTGTTTSLPNARLTVVAENTTNSQIKLRSTRTAITTNNVLGGIDFDSNDSSLTAPGVTTARIQAIATASHTTTVNDTALLFSTSSGATLVERWRINATGELQGNGNSTIRANAGNLTLGTVTSGNVVVDGAGDFSVLDAMNISGTQLTVNSSTVFAPTAIANDVNGGNIGASAAATVDVDTALILTQTTAGQTMTLFSPTNTAAGRIVYVTNSPSSTTTFSLYGVTLAIGATQGYIWNGSAWTVLGSAAAGSGVTSVGALDSQTKSVDGAVISGTSIYMQTADGTNPGLVSTGTQTFAGDKTFSGNITASGGIVLSSLGATDTSALLCRNTTNQIAACQSLTDAQISDTLTASMLVGTGSTTNAVDLATAEVSGTLAVGNGGTGATTLTSNGILYGNGSSSIQATASAVDAVLVTNGTGVPSLAQTLPNAVQTNITATGIVASGSIASGFGTISTANNIGTTAVLSGGSLSVTTSAAVGGTLSVNGLTTLSDSMIANAVATGTTATTAGTGSNTTTVTLSGAAFTNGDVIFIDNAGQDYYTRITSGGGTATLTVSPAVTFENSRTVTKYTIQNIGATATSYTNLNDRFFQGYFLGGVVVGAGSTTLSDGSLRRTAGDITIQPGTGGVVQVGGTINATTVNATTITGDGSALTNINGANISGGSIADGSLSSNVVLLNTAQSFSALQTFGAGLSIASGQSIVLGGDTVSDFVGTGLSLASGTLQTTLGTSVDLVNEVTGTLTIANGGTGATSAQDAINALAGLTTSGDLLYYDGTNTTRLARGANGNCLTSTLTGLAWGTCTTGAVTSVGTLDSQTKSANGAVLSAGTLVLQTADATNAGLVSTSAQTIAGDKTFNGQIIGSAGLSVAGTTAVNATGTAATTIGNATGALAFTGSSASTFVLGGTTLDTTELTRLNGIDAALVDVNDGVATAITGTGALSAGSIVSGFGSINIGSNTFTGDGSGLSGLNASNLTTGTVANSLLTNSGALTISAGNGLSGGGSVALGGTVSLAVAYGGAANTAVQGNTTLVCASGSGNLGGGGNTITLGSGGTCSAITTNNAVSFSTSVTTPVLSSTAGLALSSGGTSALSLDSASNTIVIASSDTVLQRSAAGSFSIDLTDSAATTFVVTNSNGTGVANLNLSDGGLQTAGTQRLTNTGALQNITGLTIASGGASVTGASSFADATSFNGSITIGDATSDRLTIASQLLGTNALVFQGAVDNGFATTFAVAEPTANNTITIPDQSGTLALIGVNAAQIDTSTNSSLFINKTGASGNLLTLQKNGAGVFTIANSGALTMQTTDTAALAIKNAGGTDFLTVDTSGAIVRVGSATLDATATLLVLDAKNTDGDPTGVIGGMYYNSFQQKYRCYEDGAWTDCLTTAVLGETTLATASNTISVTLTRPYEYLMCRLDAKGRSANAGVYLRFNNDNTGNAYSWNQYGMTNTTVTDSQDSSDSEVQLSGTATANVPFSANLNITNFSDVRKGVDWTSVGLDAIGTNPNRYSGVGIYNITNGPITSVQFITSAGTFSAGSHAWCEGRNIR